MQDEVTTRIVAFLRGIGIPVATAEVTGSFLPAIAIRDGGLLYDPARLEWPGDLLHEAGHIAVTEPARRPTLCEVQSDGGEEMAAICWSYAAARAIGIPARVVFHEHGYKGGGAHLAMQFDMGVHIGLPLLQYYGLTLDPQRAAAEGGAAYPHMRRWLR